MAENTKIEWTDHTFNPWEGCQKVGAGCDHCYAETRNARFAGGQAVNWGPGAPRRRTSASNWRKPLAWNANHEEFFAKHGRRQRVFCASLADVFDNAVDPQWRVDLFSLILKTPNIDWLLLTKRIGVVPKLLDESIRHIESLPDWTDEKPHPLEAVRNMLADWVLLRKPPKNVWLGATIVNQEEADRDIPKLLSVAAAVHFLSMEPLLGPVDLRNLAVGEGELDALKPDTWEEAIEQWRDTDEDWVAQFEDWFDVNLSDGLSGPMHSRIDWVIVGGESGPGARPMSPDWARALRDQCQAAGVPFLFKQWGEWVPMLGQVEGVPVREKSTTPDGWVMGYAGKKAAGRQLDGQTHDGFPAQEVQAA